MTTNLQSAITHKPKKDYSKFNMIRNEPVQTHFSAEGVQVYSLADIEAMKLMAERKLKNMPEGEFVKPKEYRADFADKDVDEVLSRPVTASNWRNRLLAKNQSIVRLEKENAKSDAIGKKLFLLEEKKKEAGADGPKKQFVKPPRRCELNDRDIAYSPKVESHHLEQFGVEEAEGDNGQFKPEADMRISMAQTQGQEHVKALDSSFEDVEMDGIVPNLIQNIMSKSDIFQSKLNNAISSLAGQFSSKKTPPPKRKRIV